MATNNIPLTSIVIKYEAEISETKDSKPNTTKTDKHD